MLHDLLPPWVDLQLESYANGRQAPVPSVDVDAHICYRAPSWR